MLDVIKKLRTERGITQQQLGDAVGVTQQAVNSYENNDTQADYNTLSKIADYFNVTTDYLIGRRESRDNSSFVSELGRYSFSDEDMRLIRKYLMLNSSQKKAIDNMIDVFSKPGTKK